KADLSATANNLLDAAGKVDMKNVTANIDGAIADFPLAVIDQFLANAPVTATLALRPKIETATLKADIKPTADGQSASGTFALTAKTQKLDAAITGALAADALTLNQSR